MKRKKLISLGWRPYVKSWMQRVGGKFKEEVMEHLTSLYEKYVDEGLTFVRKKCIQAIPQVGISKVTTLCKLLETLLFREGKKTH